MQKISQKYGPIISLKCGGRLAILVTSPSAVEECFIKNDIVFADRPPLLIGKYLGYNYNSMVTASYGQHWRNLRKVSLLELLSKHRLSISAGIRKDEIKRMLSKLVVDSLRVEGDADGYVKVELKSLIRGLVLNMLLRILVGKRYYGGESGVMDSDEARQFTDIINEALDLFVTLDPGDILPILRWIDYGGFVKRNKQLANKADAFLQGLIDEHKREVTVLNSTEDQPMINRLLSLQKSDPERYTDETIKGLIFVSFFLSFLSKMIKVATCDL
ncbi:hypothetical protein SOVF_086400 [Spinacia oleracea]|nr:hypothetical protein SOVF_086400 [Spinacia oleracea]